MRKLVIRFTSPFVPDPRPVTASLSSSDSDELSEPRGKAGGRLFATAGGRVAAPASRPKLSPLDPGDDAGELRDQLSLERGRNRCRNGDDTHEEHDVLRGALTLLATQQVRQAGVQSEQAAPM